MACKGASEGQLDKVSMTPCAPEEAKKLDEEVKQEEAASPDVYGHFMTILFEQPDGTTKKVEFTSKPLGFEFNTTAPVIVKRVNPSCHGEQLGVSSGLLMKA